MFRRVFGCLGVLALGAVIALVTGGLFYFMGLAFNISGLVVSK